MILLVMGITQTCNEPLMEEQTAANVELKSAQNSKTSYIVVLNDAELEDELAFLKGNEKRLEAAQRAAEKIVRRAGIVDGEIGYTYATALQGFSIKIPPGQLKKLQNDPSVRFVEPDQVVTLIDPQARPDGEEITTKAQLTPAGIKRVSGGMTYTGTNKAWIIDTGIDYENADLNVNRTLSKTFISRTTTADDDNNHGSHVAGIVAAINNDVGVVGVAAGAELVAVKVLDRRGSGAYSIVIAGVDYVAATAAPGDVANMSLGGPTSDALDAAIIAAANKGIRFALAAGNEAMDADNSSPARVDHSNVYTISAMDANGKWAYFSNFGNPPVDYCQPGVGVLSYLKNGSTGTMSGTSMAAPHMAGILLWGDPETDGHVTGDPDGNPDPIGVVPGVSNDVGTLSGTVSIFNTDPNIPIASATITIAGTSFTATSDANGDYSITGIPVGTSYSVTATANGYVSATTEGVSILKDGTTLDFALDAIPPPILRTVSGNVTDDTGALSGASVIIEGTDLAATTGPDGSYTISDVPEGIYNITASAAGYTPASRSITVQGSDLTGINFTLTSEPASNITLTATLRKVRGIRLVDLKWSGATTTGVVIKVNGVPYNQPYSQINDGVETLDMQRSSGTFTFQVCETDGTTCSNVVTLEL